MDTIAAISARSKLTVTWVSPSWETCTARCPEAEVCGWVKDMYGVSWQIVPEELTTLMDESDAGRAKRVMESLLQMKKLVIETLKKA